MIHKHLWIAASNQVPEEVAHFYKWETSSGIKKMHYRIFYAISYIAVNTFVYGLIDRDYTLAFENY